MAQSKSGWLDGDAALITGGGSGLGLALVHRFLNEGARVGVLELSAEKAQLLRDTYGNDVVVVEGDVRSIEANQRAVDETVNAFGKLDVLVGNAGIIDGLTPFLDLQAETLSSAFDAVMGINVKGYILAARAAVPELIKTQGSMVFTASSASWFPNGGGVLYTASKHAVVGLVRELAYQLAPKVRVNAVGPGPMTTDLRGAAGITPADVILSPADPAIAALVTQAFPLPHSDPAAYTGLFVAMASRANSMTTTGETINAADGYGIRGLFAPAGGREL